MFKCDTSSDADITFPDAPDGLYFTNHKALFNEWL